METSLDAGTEAISGSERETCSTLRRLGLDPTELDALRRKGYLTQDDRGHGHAGYWRLRFRLGGRARTIYLGRDERLVQRVRQELGLLQQEHRQNRQLANVTVKGKRILRAAKRRLEPLLQQLGLHYHGDALRRLRGDNKVVR